MKKDRNSNFELMRIVSMIMIVLWHIIVHGNVLSNCDNELIHTFFTFLKFIIIVHVNSFVLLMGYYQYKKEYKGSKVWSILSASIFYRVLILLIFILFNIKTITKSEIYNMIFLFDKKEYWFIITYLITYIFSPFYNILIKNINRKTYKRLIYIMLFIFSILPALSNNTTFINDGYTLYNFTLLYFIGAYLNKYSIKKELTNKMSISKYRLLLIGIFSLCIIFNFSADIVLSKLTNMSPLIKEILIGFKVTSLRYSNIIVIIQSIVYLLFFESFTFKNKYVNFLATLTLGIYMIHDNSLIRTTIYKVINIDNGIITSYSFIFYVFIITILIYIICSIIEYGRKLLFKYINSLNFSKWIKNKYYKFIENF